jgi:hypothetical protein
MAKDNPYPEPTKVEVDPQKLKEEADYLVGWGNWVLGKYEDIKGMVFPVGAFPAANRLRDRLTTYVGQQATNTYNIAMMLQKVIPDNLRDSAAQYIRDEDDNKKEASRFNKFATDAGKYGPGAEKAAPATPGLPPPTANQPVPQPPPEGNK